MGLPSNSSVDPERDWKGVIGPRQTIWEAARAGYARAIDPSVNVLEINDMLPDERAVVVNIHRGGRGWETVVYSGGVLVYPVDETFRKHNQALESTVDVRERGR